ncbi:MAG: hypothetical protein A3F31_04530 [Candidatus Levybacteria bacterium RIFCSPHIGHO2_12_FULL_38_12]|nr:MAG: hypothetical protein A2770_04215 [Candidatus Levybacteria bacterium RIFCSPHIGHO2_01_FULL_38_12]OGH21824.1 MAG: hypothetical protein A3D75_01375 [Candidatus Levybacteria bacterium RIFCSPHIGHO2_02_FULL_37_18]OGH22519.1 MAG: hypothetical protein A3F31_04530 [Candidatus Levybacteria bacterium RIFCSPHIGHO2_12_FULL_38_12]OGH33445.1 MAG: hypothetical protein A3A47_04325 [Candidatus Levybacteria bacterium RIFCSPLOWO2_01_FULL_37_20]OGH44056.1 MAG: hypothetical protein A3J14_04900 [Candidatus Lev
MGITKDVLENSVNRLTVNSKDKSIPTVNSNSGRVYPYLDGEDTTSEGVAIKLAEDLDDMKSLGYYQILAKETNPQILLDILNYTLETDKLGKIRTTKAIYFMFMLKIRGIRTKFKKEK